MKSVSRYKPLLIQRQFEGVEKGKRKAETELEAMVSADELDRIAPRYHQFFWASFKDFYTLTVLPHSGKAFPNLVS